MYDRNLDITKVLKNALAQRNNPTDFKAIHIAKVLELEPIKVSIYDGVVQLTEGVDLFISEQFRFRCNIDKTNEISTAFDNDLLLSTTDCTSAEGVTEQHSYTPNLPCEMPSAIAFLSSAIANTHNAIKRVRNELIAIKCELKKGDLVAVGSLEQLDRFILIDKVLDDDYKFYGEK